MKKNTTDDDLELFFPTMKKYFEEIEKEKEKEKENVEKNLKGLQKEIELLDKVMKIFEPKSEENSDTVKTEEEAKSKAPVKEEDDIDLIIDFIKKPQRTAIEQLTYERRQKLNNAVQHIQSINKKSIGNHKEDQSQSKPKTMKSGWSKTKVIGVLAAAVIAISILGTGINKYKNEHAAVDYAKKIVINKMEEIGFNSANEYKNANLDFDKEEAILVYIFSEILDYKEMENLIKSSTYNDGMYHYLDLSHNLTVNGFTYYDEECNKVLPNYSHWENYCINVITDAYNNGKLEDLISRLMKKSLNNFEDKDFDISYSFELQGGRNR